MNCTYSSKLSSNNTLVEPPGLFVSSYLHYNCKFLTVKFCRCVNLVIVI